MKQKFLITTVTTGHAALVDTSNNIVGTESKVLETDLRHHAQGVRKLKNEI